MGLMVHIQTAVGHGYASTTRMDATGIDDAVGLAVSQAGEYPAPGPVPEGCGEQGEYRTRVHIDPFRVPSEEYYATMDRVAAAALRHPAVRLTESFIAASRVHKVFMDTRGSEIDQQFTTCGGGIRAFAVSNGEVQRRSNGILQGDHGQAGFEFVSETYQETLGDQMGAEATALLRAPPCPAKVTNVILGTEHMALLLHESCGHASELDRVTGDELTFAGASFLTPDRRGWFRYGSSLVTITADGSTPGAMGTYGYDDEGFAPRRIVLVERGIFKAYLSSFGSAIALEEPSGGCARGEGWWGVPLVRMPNVSLAPGDISLPQLLSETDDGIVMETPYTWSIDDRRLHFHFTSELAYEVKQGKRGRLLKNASYMGVTPRFWAGCDAVADMSSWRLWGLAACGKGEPMQAMPVGHGAAPARFRDVQVGESRR